VAEPAAEIEYRVAPAGSAIYAVAAGIVRVVRMSQPYGLHVRVDHGNGYQTIYAHLMCSTVAVGDLVHAGQQVGRQRVARG